MKKIRIVPRRTAPCPQPSGETIVIVREKRKFGCLGCIGALTVATFGVIFAGVAIVQHGTTEKTDARVVKTKTVAPDPARRSATTASDDRDPAFDAYVYAQLKRFAKRQSRGAYAFVKQHSFKVTNGVVYYHKYLDGGNAKECAALKAHGTIVVCPDASLDDLAKLIADGVKRESFDNFKKKYGGQK